MKENTFILLLSLLLLVPTLQAEVVVLQTGQQIQGEIVLHNNDVIIIQTKSGIRYQYPTNEVTSIRNDDVSQQEKNQEAIVASYTRPVNLRFQIHGGAVYVPTLGWGGLIGTDFMIGSYAIKNKRMFIGGGIGYRAKIIQDKVYSFIPLQAVVAIPLMESKNAPIIGMNIGYGFSTNKQTEGGICVGTNVGWNYLINQQSSLSISLFAEWQQARIDIKQTIDDISQEGIEYINHMGCYFISTGLKLGISF